MRFLNFVLSLVATLLALGACVDDPEYDDRGVPQQVTATQKPVSEHVERLQKLYPGAAVFDWILTSGDGSALNTATCNSIHRNTSGSLDGTEILVNGKFPAPTVRVKLGQWIIIRVENRMEQATITIHWHGLFQAETPEHDGTSMVAQ